MADRNVRKDPADLRPVESIAAEPTAQGRGRLARLFSFFGRLFERRGTFYLIGFAIAVSAVVAFGWLASEVMEQELRPINESIMLGIHRHAGPQWDPIARGVTDLGSVIFVSAVGVVVGGLFIYRRRMLDAATLAIVLVGGGILSTFLKLIFQQQRPRLFPSVIPLPPDYSFPSGHSLISFCLYGFIAVWLVSDRPHQLWRWPVAAVILSVAPLVAFSRLYLGVHWPSDVTAGMLVATFWVAFCMTGRSWWINRARSREIPVVRSQERAF